MHGENKDTIYENKPDFKNGALRGNQETLKGPDMISQKRHLRRKKDRKCHTVMFSPYILCTN